MSSLEFDTLAPSEWVDLYTQWKRKELREDYRVARMVQAVFAIAGRETALRDHLPNPPPLLRKPKQKPKSRAQMVKEAKLIERQLLALFPSAKLKPQWQPTQ